LAAVAAAAQAARMLKTLKTSASLFRAAVAVEGPDMLPVRAVVVMAAAVPLGLPQPVAEVAVAGAKLHKVVVPAGTLDKQAKVLATTDMLLRVPPVPLDMQWLELIGLLAV